MTPLVRAAGPRAVLLEVDGSAPDPSTPAAVVAAWQDALEDLVARGLLPPPADVVPGALTLLLDGVDAAALAPHLATLDRAATTARPPGEGAEPEEAGGVVEVPVVYDGADLAEVARRWGTDRAGVVAHHTSTVHRVAFCGFAPGFPYLLPVDGPPETGPGSPVPRHPSPRPSVPAGSVGLAGRYCGIYPSASPGGWQLLGTTDVRLFDPGRTPPALLPPGTRVRFVEARRDRSAGAAPRRSGVRSRPLPEPPRSRATGARCLEVVRPGALTTVQDGGRHGLAALGVPRAGPLDAPAARLANRLVGNPETAALLETTLDGVALRATSALTVAVTGADAPLTVGGRPAPVGVAVPVPAGAVVDVGTARAGVRSYLAVRGGVEVPAVLGSRSRDTLAGLGPPPPAVGSVLPVGQPPAADVPAVDFTVPAPPPAEVVLRLAPGPRDDWFGPAGLAALGTTAWALSPESNRVGARLLGAPLPRLRSEELESEGIVAGAVQVPPDGRPVVLLADHPTTGGYPVVGVVHPVDLAALAQARPGTRVRVTVLAAPAVPPPPDASGGSR